MTIDQYSTTEFMNQFSSRMMNNQGEWILVSINTTKKKVFYEKCNWDRLIYKVPTEQHGTRSRCTASQ